VEVALSNHITKGVETMVNIIKGVGLLLFEPQGKLLVLRELQDKPHIKKEAGMLSFPLETTEGNETFEETLWRLVSQEIGVALAMHAEEIGRFKFFYDTCTVHACMFAAHVQQTFIARPTDTDIIYHGWMHPTDLLEVVHKRVEVAPILRSHLKL